MNLSRNDSFFCRNKYLVFTFAIIAIIYFVRFMNYDLYEDDYIYKKAAVCSLPQIWQFIKWHMTKYNGRTLIHTVLIFFLKSKFSIAFCKLMCAFFIPFTGYIISSTVTPDSRLKEDTSIFSLGVFSLVGTVFYCESIYWISGAFNYFYPTLGIIGAFILYIKKPESIWLFPLSFILGATTEQTGIMAVGLFVILLADYIIQNKKLNIRLAVQIFLSVAGYFSVIFSEGTASRMEKQGGINIPNIIKGIYMVFKEKWFASLNIWFILAIITLSLCFWLKKFEKAENIKLNKIFYSVNKFLSIYLIVMFIANSTFIILNKLRSHLFPNSSLPVFLNNFVFVVWIIYVTVFFISFGYVTILIYLKKKSNVPFISFALGTGSQMVMGISTKTLFRACLPAILMYMIFMSYTFVEIYSEYKDKIKEKTFKTAKLAVCLLCVVMCIANAAIMGHFMDFKMPSVVDNIEPMTEEQMTEYTDMLYEKNTKYYKEKWATNHVLSDFSNY